MTRRMVSAACGLWMAVFFALPVTAQSGSPILVVELFTSQGCSACPPADEFFAKLSRDPTIMPLALHVDYWDYIGWADSFADPAYTARQKAYARAAGSRMIYTPQMIVGGLDRVEGNAPTEIASLMMKHMKVTPQVTVNVTRQGDRLLIRAAPAQPLGKLIKVQVVRYLPEEAVEITRGENAGRTVTYRNIVTSWNVVGDWDGAAPLELEAPYPAGNPGVVILQADGPAEILAAARVN